MVVGAHAEGGWTLAIICCVWRMKFAWRGILEIAAKAVLTLAVEFSTCTPRAARLRDLASVVSAARPSASMQHTAASGVGSPSVGEHAALVQHTAASGLAAHPWAASTQPRGRPYGRARFAAATHSGASCRRPMGDTCCSEAA